MAVVQAQAIADSTPSTPVKLFTSPADCVVNVFCCNDDSSPQQAFVEVRLQDASQAPEQLLVPGVVIPPNERILEGSIYLTAGDAIYVYGTSDMQVFHLYGQTL